MDKTNIEQKLMQTHSRWELSTNFVKMVANHHKLPNLNTESLNLLSYDCTYQLFTLLGCAKKIANQCKREHLKESDIVAAQKMCGFEGLYGSGYPQINYQLQPISSVTVNSGGGNRSKGMLSYTDKEFDLESFLSQPPLKLPREVVIHEHWLSINGMVPDIPENIPQSVENNVKKLELAESTSNSFNYQHSNIDGMATNPKNSTNNLFGQPLTVFSDRVPLLIERQLVYKELTEACFGPNENKKKEALTIMSTDLVMKELTPHFACFVRETTKTNVLKPNLGILLNCVRVVIFDCVIRDIRIKAIFENIYLKKEFMQNHLHFFVPSLLNCIVSRRMCVKSESENHWALRCFASKTLANICSNFQNSLPSLSLRVCNVAKRVIECCQTLSTNEHYLVNNNDGKCSKNSDDFSSTAKDENDDLIKFEDVEHCPEDDLLDILDTHNPSPDNGVSTVDVDSIPFSSYYGAATLLFDLGANMAKLTLLPLLPKLGQLIETTLEGSNDSSHELAKYEANHLKELLIKQTKYIIGSSILRGPDDVEECCANYGSYLGPFIYKELASIKNAAGFSQQHTSHCTPSTDKQSEDNKHVL